LLHVVVTMTTVYSREISLMSSSMCAVAMGSSAEAGSSMSKTSGSTASARAMQRRCCWPPERPERVVGQAVLDLVPEGRLLEGALDALGDLALVLEAADAQAVGDVLEDRLRERVRALEHHADAPPHRHGIDAGP
jgi:hypothetical protein